MGNTQIGKTGLGYIKRRKRFNDEKQQNHQDFLGVISKEESESLYTKAVQQLVKGQWSKWQGCIKRYMSWLNLPNSTPQLALFCLGATCNTLTSPQNKPCCGFEDDTVCALFRKEEERLAGCQKALQCERYTFCHNAVLRVTVHEMQVMIN